MKIYKKTISAIVLIGWYLFPIIFRGHFNTWSLAPKIVLLIIIFCSELVAWLAVLEK